MAAQFAGVVSSPLAFAEENSPAAASHMHPHAMSAHGGHMMMHDDRAKPHSHGERGVNHHADHCCALHAFFAGVLPAAIAIDASRVIGQRFVVGLLDVISGIDPARLDRPPRSPIAI